MTARPLYPRELMDLAGRLAGRGSGPGRPRTVDLRRAVSTAYYGLFHAWTWAAAAELFDRNPDDPRASTASRWIAHADLLELANSVLLAAGSGDVTRSKVGAAAKHIDPLLARPLHPGLVDVCRRFTDLQEQRHEADYNRDFDIDRPTALEAVDNAREAWVTLWRLYAEREANTVLVLRLSVGATRVARAR